MRRVDFVGTLTRPLLPRLIVAAYAAATLAACAADLSVAGPGPAPAAPPAPTASTLPPAQPAPRPGAEATARKPQPVTPAPAAEPALFDADVVHPLHLRFTSSAWQAQQADLAAKLGPAGRGKGVTDGYQHEDLAWTDVELAVAGQVLPHVGMRWNGRGTLLGAWHAGQQKLPFRIDFDEFAAQYPDTKGRKVQGFGKLTCANGQGDATYLRHVLASEILRNRGVPAPQAAFFRVTLDRGDGKVLYAGLYSCLEDPSDVLPERDFAAADGNVYKPEGSGADWVSFNQGGFAKKTNKKAGDWADVEAAVSALHAPRTDAAKWRNGLQAAFDVGGFLRWLAVNTAMWNPDTYGMRAANYYLVGVPQEGGRLHWVPWDQGEALTVPRSWPTREGEPKYDIGYVRLDHISPQWPLIRWLMDDPVLRGQYQKELGWALQGAFAPQEFAKRAKALHALIAPHVHGANGEQAPWTTLYPDNKGQFAPDPPDGLIDHVAAMHALVAKAAAQ